MTDYDGESTLMVDEHTVILIEYTETPLNVTATEVGPPGNLLPGVMLHDYSIKGQTFTWDGAQSVSLDNGNVIQATLTGNTSLFSITGWPGAGEEGKLTLYIQQGAGPFTLGWPAGINWVNNPNPELAAGVGKWDVFALTSIDAGATIFGFHVGRTL